MFAVANPEVLAHDWLPPVPIAREREVQEVVRRLDPPVPVAPAPWVVGVAGPSGSGSSTVARRAAREVLDRVRRSPLGPSARLYQVRVAGLRGPHGVATALLRLVDEGFDGRGFPVAEILAGWLRRLRRDGQPAVIVLDDVAIGGPDLVPVLRALALPDRFLPEGQHGLPPCWIVLAGTAEGLEATARAARPVLELGPLLALGGYPAETVRSIVRDRAQRALGRPVPSGLLERVVTTAIEDGGGSRRAVDLLRRELLGGRSARPGFVPRAGEAAVRVEPWVADAIGRVSQERPARLADVRRVEAELARAQGAQPLPTTTFWRRIVRLEQAGYVRREIRTGGSGGTLSLLRLLTPIEEWIRAPPDLQTRRAAGPLGAGARPDGWGAGRPPGWPPVPAG